MYTTCKSIWGPSLTLALLWLQICQKKCTLTVQEDHPQDYPQQTAHRQSVKPTRVRSSNYYVTCKQISSPKKDDHWREKEKLHLEREEQLKSMEYLQEQERKAREEEHNEQDHLFSQWACVQMNIQQLSVAPSTETCLLIS